jgi:Skp family chaperone for outer membrane proteins
MKKLLLALMILGTVCTASAQRIAVVDLKRVFDQYYKSRIAEEFLKQQAEAVKLHLAQLTRQQNTLQAEANRLATNAQNMALDAAAREKARQDAENALRQLQLKKSEIQMYLLERRREMQELEKNKRQEIIADIQAEVRKRAAAGGYDYVFDSSGKTVNDQPALLIFPEKHDISEAVIRELNRTASTPKPQSPSTRTN